jgi:hypothetical protein
MGAPPALLCPCAAMTERQYPRARAPLASQGSVGVFPLSCVHRRGGTEEGEWGKREGGEKGEAAHRDAAGASKPEAIREQEPEPPRLELLCHGESHSCPRNWSRGSAATGNTYIADVNVYTEPATTTPPTQREH